MSAEKSTKGCRSARAVMGLLLCMAEFLMVVFVCFSLFSKNFHNGNYVTFIIRKRNIFSLRPHFSLILGIFGKFPACGKNWDFFF